MRAIHSLKILSTFDNDCSMQRDKDNFFDKNADRYRKVIENQDFVKQSSLSNVLSSLLTGNILDIGNGGIVDYDPGHANSLFSLDKSFNMLKRGDPILSGRSICGDLKNLPIKKGSFDVILCKYLFHHLVKGTIKETENYQRDCLKQILQVLRPNGKVIIVENCISRWIEWIELSGFSLWQNIFSWLGFPMLRFFSLQQLSFLLRSTGFTDLHVHRIHLKKSWKFIPFLTSFPWFRIPAKFYPFEILLIEARAY